MANINKIRLSGQTYNIEDVNASKTVELTQAQYDALAVKDPNTFYIITDAEGADLSNYYTKSETSGATQISTALASKADAATTYTKTETDNAITAATSTKQDTLVSGTNIKTINNESILGSGNIDIQGGGDVTVDPSLDSGSTNPVANSAITTAINSKAELSNTVTDVRVADILYGRALQKRVGNSGYSTVIYYGKINDANIVDSNSMAIPNFQLVETSAITSAITSGSTDAQVPSAKAVYDQLGGMKIVKLTESEYTALVTKDSNTLYVVVPDPSN